MRPSISYEFYKRYFEGLFDCFVKCDNTALVFIYVYEMIDAKGLVQDFRELKYAGCTLRVTYLLEYALGMLQALYQGISYESGHKNPKVS